MKGADCILLGGFSARLPRHATGGVTIYECQLSTGDINVGGTNAAETEKLVEITPVQIKVPIF